MSLVLNTLGDTSERGTARIRSRIVYSLGRGNDRQRVEHELRCLRNGQEVVVVVLSKGRPETWEDDEILESRNTQNQDSSSTPLNATVGALCLIAPCLVPQARGL